MSDKTTITKKQLRIFGIALACFLAILGFINMLKGNTVVYQSFWGVSIVVFFVSILLPIIIKPIYKIALFIAHILGWVNTRLFLGIIFYLIFTPISLVFKLMKKDPLDRKFDKNKKSYWQFRQTDKENNERYLKQF